MTRLVGRRRRSPTSGSPNVVAHVADRVLHLRVDRPERRNAYTQDMYRAVKRAAIWADRQPELDAVCLTGTDEWFGVGGDLARRTGADDLDTGVGRHRPLPVPAHRAVPQDLGGARQRPVRTRAGSTSRCTAT